MRRLSTTLTLTAALALSMSCGGEEPPPEGYHLILRLVSLDPSVLDELRVNFEPQGTDERFMSIEPMTYADGAINLSVEPDGVLVMTLSGAHVAALASDDDGDGTREYDLEVWSDDTRTRSPAPSVRVIGLRGGEAIAEGFLFLPQWPLPNSQSSTVQVECRMAVSDRCIP